SNWPNSNSTNFLADLICWSKSEPTQINSISGGKDTIILDTVTELLNAVNVTPIVLLTASSLNTWKSVNKTPVLLISVFNPVFYGMFLKFALSLLKQLIKI
uniref:Uncharacterized protein n=1 Tax=Glossina palpalis gambiensis TaxID=67801 RepID=A0A1B0C4V0_9MUSC